MRDAGDVLLFNNSFIHTLIHSFINRFIIHSTFSKFFVFDARDDDDKEFVFCALILRQLKKTERQTDGQKNR